jgi:hypothetical protein
MSATASQVPRTASDAELRQAVRASALARNDPALLGRNGPPDDAVLSG